MGLKIEFHPEARVDLIEAVEWYEAQQNGLGIDFFNHFRKTRELIAEHPRLYRKTHRQFRKAIIKKFPYCIIYRSNNDHIFILAVFHNKRDSKTWKDRID